MIKRLVFKPRQRDRGGTPPGHATLELFARRVSDTALVPPDSALLSSMHNEYELPRRGIFWLGKGGYLWAKVYAGCLQKIRIRRKTLTHLKSWLIPSIFWDFTLWGGGSSAVVFCTTDSQYVYGTLLSLDFCMFSPQTNPVGNWQMQGVKYWLRFVSARECVQTSACVHVFFFGFSGCRPGFITVCYQGDISHFHLPHVPSFFVLPIKDRKLNLNQFSITTLVFNFRMKSVDEENLFLT